MQTISQNKLIKKDEDFRITYNIIEPLNEAQNLEEQN